MIFYAQSYRTVISGRSAEGGGGEDHRDDDDNGDGDFTLPAV